MKALSFRQPWAELVLQGRKTMDLRTYTTQYRGRIAIHASQTVEAESAHRHGFEPEALDSGALVGTVELVEVIPLDEAAYEAHREEHLAGRGYREGMFGWLLARPERLPQPIPARGRTNLFNVDLDALDSATRGPAAPEPLRPPVVASEPGDPAGLNRTTPKSHSPYTQPAVISSGFRLLDQPAQTMYGSAPRDSSPRVYRRSLRGMASARSDRQARSGMSYSHWRWRTIMA
jgi:hypothetical protein